uniref:Uncharacterized protein n=1 Tax=Rhizophora mucronata TaxID=61149 RepID=A0A2P2NPQ9_RHIMU
MQDKSVIFLAKIGDIYSKFKFNISVA